MPHRSRERAAAARCYVDTANEGDAEELARLDRLHRMLNVIPPEELSDGETIVMLEILLPVYRRLTGKAVVPVVPRLHQLCEVMAVAGPRDLSAGERAALIAVLIPAHSRALARVADPCGRPLQRFLPTRLRGVQSAPQVDELAP